MKKLAVLGLLILVLVGVMAAQRKRRELPLGPHDFRTYHAFYENCNGGQPEVCTDTYEAQVCILHSGETRVLHNGLVIP